MAQVGAAALPVMVALILFFGAVKGVPVFDTFLSGAKEGIRTSLKLLPTLIGLIVAVTMVRASGLLELLCGLLVNRALGWAVWDYSAQPGNLWGQICPLYTLLWIPLSALAAVADWCFTAYLLPEPRSQPRPEGP